MNQSSFFNKLNLLFFLTIIVFLLGDVLRKSFLFFNADFIRYTAISKLVVLFLYTVFFIVFFRRYYSTPKIKSIIKLTVILFFWFLLSQIILNRFLELSLSNKNTLNLFRYLFWPFTIIIFFPFLIENKYNRLNTKFFESILFVNCGLIVLAYLFQIKIFKTYQNPLRFGYSGIYNNHNQVSYYFIIFIVYYYYLAILKKKFCIKLILLILVSLLIGTKKIYFFLFLLLMSHVAYFKLYKRKVFYISLSVLGLLFFLFYPLLFKILNYHFSSFFRLINDHSVLTGILSYRDYLFIEAINYIKNDWGLLNFFIGGANFDLVRSEMELFDLYMFFGFFGLLYFYKIFKAIFEKFTHKKFFILLIFMLTAVSFLASGFLPNSNLPIVFLLVLISVNAKENNRNVKNSKMHF